MEPNSIISNKTTEEIFQKLQAYKERVLNNASLDNGADLYMEPCVINHSNETTELIYDVRGSFLQSSDCNSPKVLLLTGKVGSGKSLFCKRLQREILLDWEGPQNKSIDERKWFAISIPPSDSKKTKPIETLTKELCLIKEEISELQILNSSNSLLPQFLFIFDGYDDFISDDIFNRLKNRGDYVANDFCDSNELGPIWKNSKIIITCREEGLKDFQQSNLLFSLLSEAKDLPQHTFMQRNIEPFSHEQISCYLKKYYYLATARQEFEESSSFPFILNPSIGEAEVRSWVFVEKIEKIIDSNNARELARIPATLYLMANVLARLALEGKEPKNWGSIQSKRFLIETFINQVVSASVKQKLIAGKLQEENEEQLRDVTEKQVMRKIMDQMQSLALRLRNYKEVKAVAGPHEDSVLSELHSIIELDKEVRFRNSLFRDFFIVKTIEEEIIDSANSSQDEKMKFYEGSIFNQKLINHGGSSNLIDELLCDAIREGRITASQLLALIQLSKRKAGIFTPKAEESKTDSSQVGQADLPSKTRSPFAVAAANAINLLNFTGFDFKKQDFSYICVPDANLSYGMFEETSFAHANLQGVNLTGAWLLSTSFINANLKDTDFGECPCLEIKGKVLSIACSPHGKYLAVDMTDETFIFEKSFDRASFHFKEIRKLPGESPSKISCPFSEDEKQIATVIVRNDKGKAHFQLQIWDINSGQLINSAGPFLQGIPALHLSSNHKDAFFCRDNKIHRYDFASKSLTCSTHPLGEPLTADDFRIRGKLMLIAEPRRRIGLLYNTENGECLQKQAITAIGFDISFNGKQIAYLTSTYVRLLDCARGHLIKSLYVPYQYSSNNSVNGCTLSRDDKSIIIHRTNTIGIRDTATAIFDEFSPPKSSIKYKSYSFSLDGSQIAILDTENAIAIKNLILPQSACLKGPHGKGLNLQGTDFHGAIEMSEENIMIFKQKGDYHNFDVDSIKKLFLGSAKEAESVKDFILANRNLATVDARVIGRDTRWVNLQRLDLSRNQLGDEGGECIVNNVIWVHLEELILTRTQVGPKTGAGLGHNQTWKDLKKLHLDSNKISDSGVEEIAKNEAWVNLEELDLSNNSLGPRSMEFIVKNDSWKQLKVFNFNDNRMESVGASILANHTGWKNLETLGLENNEISANGAIELSKNIRWSKLQSLNLGSNSILSNGANWLRENEAWENLKMLYLQCNPMCEKGVLWLSRNKTWTNLESLDLYNHGLGYKGAAELSKSTILGNLKILNLGKNSIFAEGAAHLSQNTAWKELQVLILDNNGLGDGGTVELSKNKNWENLQMLSLTDNFITGQGAIELSKNDSWVTLKTLKLAQNKINSEGVNCLWQNPNWKNLAKIES